LNPAYQTASHKEPQRPSAGPPSTLRILSLNIVVGLRTSRPHHYLTQAWRHALPSPGVRQTLDRIAELAARYDVVALQEADAGSLRTGFLNQVHYLAERAGFPNWEVGINRDYGVLAKHCLGVMSHFPLNAIHHALPGRLRGRGLLDVTLDCGQRELRFIVTHLSLTRAARAAQLSYISELIAGAPNAIVVGDLNCEPHELLRHAGLHLSGLRPQIHHPTYPSWQPNRCIDQVMIAGDLRVTRAEVLQERLSDHLPIALHLDLGP
jgi:endonuclease/exonuclease/phosphatase family metal-dependent hydrolase